MEDFNMRGRGIAIMVVSVLPAHNWHQKCLLAESRLEPIREVWERYKYQGDALSSRLWEAIKKAVGG